MRQDYRNDGLRELRNQLRFAPRSKKIEQASRAESLLSELDGGRDYALDYITYRITEFRSEHSSRQKIAGNDLIHDLTLFIEDVSDDADIRIDEAGEPVQTVEELSKSLRVSTKTISRWRDQGLVSRRFVMDGRKRVGFLQSSVDRFVSSNRERVKRGERFSQLSEDERSEMIDSARRMAAAGCGLSEVTRRLGQQMNRSPETIRYTLKGFDQQFPELAVFPGHNGALSEEDKRSIFQQSKRGISLTQLARRYGRNPSSIARILGEQRAQQVLDLPLDYIYNSIFDRSGNDEEFLGPMPISHEPARKLRVPSGLPPYLASLYDLALLTKEQEQHLFRQMNYLKHKAAKLRESLDPSAPTAKLMDEIEQLYEAAVKVKNQIVQANLRLVVAIAKRHVNSSDDFFSLVSDGNISLIRAVEKFDYSRGNKFSTYASWAIMKNFARSIPDEFKHRDRFRTSSDEMVFTEQEDDRINPFAEESTQRKRIRQVNRIMHRLDDREQKIIMARFGLGSRGEPLTLKEVGEEMGVTKERVRQLEARALTKLRQAATENKIEVELE
jgi:RNA polymerase primary sigma factor/RNA polymerase sigma factor